MAATTLGKTERRVNALRFISQGTVTYAPKKAQWSVDGEAVSGWDYRTFTEIRAARNLLNFGKPNATGVSKVDLTVAGKALLTSWLD